MQSRPNYLRAAQVDADRAFIAEDMAALADRHDKTERIRKQRGELSDRRFLEKANREAWQ